MNSRQPITRFLSVTVLSLLLGVTCLPGQARAQGRSVDLARTPVQQIAVGATTLDASILSVNLGMKWGEARAILENAGAPYIIQKGTSPVVYVPPQNPTYYFVLNASSYEVIEMGIMGTADLPNENQFLFDAARWRLTSARTQFFGTEGEYIVNEEGECYNFPFQGFVLKFLSTGAFRFVMVHPTNDPITRQGASLQDKPKYDPPVVPPPPPPVPPTRQEVVPTPPPPAPEVDAELLRWQDRFSVAREYFESRKYSIGVEEFRAIAAGCPDEMLRARAKYWVGECLFGMKNYRQAREVFLSVLSETNVESLRAPAQYMASKCNKLLH